MKLLPSRLLPITVSAFLFCAYFGTPVQGQLIQIDEVKANYINGFLQYVDWTANQNEDGLVIGVVGSNEIHKRLVSNIESPFGHKQITAVVSVQPGDDLSSIDVLFIAKGNKSIWSKLRDSCREHKILAIGEEEGFLSAGGCIEFVTRKNNVRFIIHMENSSLNGVDYRSKLLDVALDIR